MSRLIEMQSKKYLSEKHQTEPQLSSDYITELL
jgi:hypothetical protein